MEDILVIHSSFSLNVCNISSWCHLVSLNILMTMTVWVPLLSTVWGGGRFAFCEHSHPPVFLWYVHVFEVCSNVYVACSYLVRHSPMFIGHIHFCDGSSNVHKTSLFFLRYPSMFLELTLI